MRVVIFAILAFFARAVTSACECEHIYDMDVMAIIDAEGDFVDKKVAQFELYYEGPRGPSPKKLLQQAQYAFDSFHYNKCLEKIKDYERLAFPPPYFPSPQEELTILAYKAYANRFLKKYNSAIKYFSQMIDIIEEDREDYLAPECLFITYFERAQCYLLKGDKKGFRDRIRRIIESGIAPKYEYYVSKNFNIHHQPCCHVHGLSNQERIVFKEIAPILLGEKLYALLEEKEQIPKIRTVTDGKGDSHFCRRMCYRAGIIGALIVGCLTRSKEAVIAALALSELLIDCEVCCEDGWTSKECCRDLKWALHQVCQQNWLLS
jgi:tetratricopeptide (TPR) repeat protein